MAALTCVLKLALMAFLCLSSFSHAIRVSLADPKIKEQFISPPDDVDGGVHEVEWGKKALDVPHYRLVEGSEFGSASATGYGSGTGSGYGSGSGSGSGYGYGSGSGSGYDSGTGSGYGSGFGSGSGYGYGRGSGSGSGSGTGTGVGIGIGRGSGSGYGPGGSGTGIGIGVGQGGGGNDDCGYQGCNNGPISCNPTDGCNIWPRPQPQPPIVIPPCYRPPTDCAPYDNCPPYIPGDVHQEGHHHQSTTAAGPETAKPRSGPAQKKFDGETQEPYVVHNMPHNEARVGSAHQGAPQVQQMHH